MTAARWSDELVKAVGDIWMRRVMEEAYVHQWTSGGQQADDNDEFSTKRLDDGNVHSYHLYFLIIKSYT